ncbi:LysR family transcriptional regulator [Diaphorobacter sp. HDW4A]|uniref:LysR family transcriptional regulator n=1 Tax=Diaphorobacter sp. HDW4A TaxID=2714924 RepID=UPI001F0E7E5F|nr:LysR family transcriptional regulator [Diaphorobacter sp. HDW4A]
MSLLPTLRQLELLLSIAEAGSIASAGSKIGMTPSATSHALRSLESTLGTILVDRSASTVELTQAGERILPHVRDAFAALNLVKTTANANAGLQGGVLGVGSFGPSSSLNLLPPLLAAFGLRHPAIEVRVAEKSDSEIELDIIERRVEIGFVTLPKPQFDTLALAVDELVAVLPAQHFLASNETIELSDLTTLPLILTHAGSQELILRMFARAELQPHFAHEMTQLLSILEFVARGQGVSINASLALPTSYAGVVYRKIRPRTARQVGLACLNAKRLSPAASAFWQLARSSKR